MQGGDVLIYSLFGHRDFRADSLPYLYGTLEHYIQDNDSVLFMIGNEGSFDLYVQSLLKKLKLTYPEMNYHIVLAYLPKPHDEPIEQSVYPEGLEKTPKRFAILKRNQWMIDNSDAVLYYSERTWGGVATATEYARKKDKALIPLKTTDT